MIASLRGRIVSAAQGQTVVEVGGGGYLVATTASAARMAAAADGGEVTLVTHLHVRDDALQLFGFASTAGRFGCRNGSWQTCFRFP